MMASKKRLIAAFSGRPGIDIDGSETAH